MEQYIMKGGNPLVGEVTISGAKNAALGILAAAIMTDDDVVIDNLPDVSDINALLEAISHLGAKVERIDRHTVKINAENIHAVTVEDEHMRKIRASYYFIGALLGKYKSAVQNATLGASITGWLSLNPPEQLQDNVDEPVVWYFFEKDGTPKTGPEDGKASTSDFVKINGKTYLFDQKGNPVKGLKKIQIGSTGEYTSYYFDASSRISVKGKMTVEEGDGNKTTFYFNEGTYAGRGVSGVKNGYLYYMGKLQEADSSSRYALISIPNGSSGYQTYVVNSSGRISKNTTVKDRDGNKFKVNSSGILTQINDETASTKEEYGEPTEPVFEND